jgi:hypothetical protein
MKLRLRLATAIASLLAGIVSTGSTVFAASSTQASYVSPSVAAVNHDPCRNGCWDHRWDRSGDRRWDHRWDRHNEWDRRDWHDGDWDHRSSGWRWEDQCSWAWYHDRGWWWAYCS